MRERNRTNLCGLGHSYCCAGGGAGGSIDQNERWRSRFRWQSSAACCLKRSLFGVSVFYPCVFVCGFVISLQLRSTGCCQSSCPGVLSYGSFLVWVALNSGPLFLNEHKQLRTLWVEREEVSRCTVRYRAGVLFLDLLARP